MDKLLMWRGEFPVLERTTYMISNSVGAMPRAVYEEMRAYANSWVERGVRAGDSRRLPTQSWRRAFSAFLQSGRGVRPGDRANR